MCFDGQSFVFWLIPATSHQFCIVVVFWSREILSSLTNFNKDVSLEEVLASLNVLSVVLMNSVLILGKHWEFVVCWIFYKTLAGGRVAVFANYGLKEDY